MRALVALMGVVAIAACGGSPATSVPGGQRGVPANYPFTVVESEEHRAAMRAEWERLFEEYAIPPERRRTPELAPFTHTPESILGLGPIRLATAADQGAIPEERLRLLVRDFISRHAQALGVAPGRISLEEVRDAGASGKRYVFAQTGFPHPVVAPAGRLELVVSPAGEIVQISDTAIPFAELPAVPIVASEDAAARVVGRTFTYSDIAGREQQVTVTDPAAVVARRLVVYPERTDAALRVRLAWEVEAGQGMTWTVFVDAITGEIVGTRQNFQT